MLKVFFSDEASIALSILIILLAIEYILVKYKGFIMDPGFSQSEVTTLFIILLTCFSGIAIGTTIALVKGKKKKKEENKE